jgi:hypothetical protein
MNDRPRRKRHFPKGLPVEADLCANQKNRLVQPSNSLPIECPSVDWTAKYTSPTCKGPHMIRRAYTEPLGYNLTENILLQRNFIID